MRNAGILPTMSITSTISGLQPVWRQILLHYFSEPTGALMDLSIPEPSAVFLRESYFLIDLGDLTPSSSAGSLCGAGTGATSCLPLE